MDDLVANTALDAFNQELDVSQPSQPYISAVGPNTVTVSGPPQVLDELLENSATFKGAGLAIPIFAPYHAPQLFRHVDIRKLVLSHRSQYFDTANHYQPYLPLLSTSTGTRYTADTTLALFEEVIHDTLTQTLRWDRAIEGCVSDVVVAESSLTEVLAFGQTKAASSLVSALQAQSNNQVSLQDSSSWTSRSQSKDNGPRGSFNDSKLAVVGLAGRFPNGANIEGFWETLEKGLDVHKEIPKDRFDVKTHVDPDGKGRNTTYTPYGCFIDNPGHFDPRFFNMSPREAAQTDPMQRLALVTAYEALEMAGYVPNRTASTTLDRVGTFYGQTSDDYRECNSSQNVDTYFITGGIRAFGPGRINYHFKFSGPSFNVDTACSSSLAAIQIACTSLWNGECDTAVAGGLSILTSPDLYAGLSRGQFLSKTGSCKTFDDAADGYCRGDSIGTVILKRLDDAVADKDNILGVILGAATNHSADAISITHPHAQTQEALYRKVLAQGAISAFDVDYVEMHGTGTQAGDGAEMESISNVFAPAVAGRKADKPLYVGSVKANVGHGEAASGVTALIKSLLMLKKDMIPPHTGIKGSINQKFPDLDQRKIRIALSKTPFRAHTNNKRRLLVNNFRREYSLAARRFCQKSTDFLAKPLIHNNSPPNPAPLPNCSALQYKDSYTTFVSRWHSAAYGLLWGIKPEIVIGHSLGEYAALNAAGVLSANDVIFLIGRRAQLLEEKCLPGTHSMLAVKGEVSLIKQRLFQNGWNLEIACVNKSDEVVLSGEFSEIEVASKELTGLGIKSTRLDVPFAFHSSQVEPILASFEEQSRFVHFNEPNIPIISPLLGNVIEEADTVNAAYLSKHTRETVEFDAALRNAQQRGMIGDHTAWVEIGPHPICLGMIKAATKPGVSVASLRRKENAWETLANSVKELHSYGLNLDWAEYHRDFLDNLELLDLPTYAFEDKNYWLDYKNDWSLTKGIADEEGNQESLTPRFSTTTLQRIVTEDFDGDKASVVFESDFSEPSLHAAVVGHLVNESGLCPSSIYADMALSAAHYIHQQLLPTSPEPGMNVKAMEVSKPVIVSTSNTNEPHLLQISATADLSTGKVDLDYSSVDIRNRSRIRNAHCFVEYGNTEDWSSDWARSAFLIESRIQVLESEMAGGSVQRILKGMAYKLFGALVQYAESYRGMEEILLLSNQREAAAKVKFQADGKDGNFFFSPYWIDSLAHLSGFVLNANDALDSKTQVFISHGWESMRFAVPFSAENAYRTYVKMQPEAKSTVMAGNVYILEGNVVVGLIEGLKFQQVPRTLLDHLLPPASRAKAAKTSALPATPSQPIENGRLAKIARSNPTAADAVQMLPLPPGPSISDRVGQIITAEVGIPENELLERSSFSELGIDSLLSLTIIGKLREELEIPISSSIFLDYDTFGELRKHLLQYDTVNGSTLTSARVNLTQAALVEKASSTPPEMTPSNNSQTSSLESIHDAEATNAVKTIIAEEMGLDLVDVPATTPLGSLGMDSLMSLTILGSLREKTGLEISPDLLADDPTIQDLDKRLTPPVSTLASFPPDDNTPTNVARDYPAASSILLQGSAITSSRKLFLFPDGSGSASNYTSLPTLAPSLAVFGLNCPFLKSPRDYTCGINGVAQIYIAEIQRRQPRGPYTLGGWSVGGIIAYEAVYQLIQAGEVVDQLILIDSPCPLLLPPLPISLVRFFDSLGLFGPPGQTPPWLMEHFEASVANLHRYKPTAIEPIAKAPKTFALWAQDGVCKDPLTPRPGLDGEESRSKAWILDNRGDFGANQWDELVGGRENVEGRGVPGNHFTMMREPNVTSLGQQIAYALNTL
ncbi:Type I Iterative PKS [Bacidia gigantensis]|uniref:Type I Iterative PKS n=1 Tax=Bacidia gigantensis TaxID=2732470 RepID=UPI001D042278|nr:Type I Iterative PKS [Bacidia gigantensis]KAG8532386.1 Type I Iterative PKS [Bacidia gigantensis]